MDRRKALNQFIKQRGIIPSHWAAEAQIRESTLRGFLTGRSKTTTIETLDRLAKAANASVLELLGEAPPRPRGPRDAVPVKSLEVRAAAGSGFEVLTEPEGPPFYFRKDWLEAMFGGDDGRLRVIGFEGDSMLPTIQTGDLGLVLTGLEDREFLDGKIYVLWDRGLVVKRLERALGGGKPKLRVISDNTALYQPYEIDAESARIVGRVLWRGGRL